MWFLPLTLAVAGAAWALGGATRAVAVLVVATPCPLILARTGGPGVRAVRRGAARGGGEKRRGAGTPGPVHHAGAG